MNFKYIENQIIEIPFFTNDECEKCIIYSDEKEKLLKRKNQTDSLESFYPDITTQCYNDYNFFKDNPQYIERLKNKIDLVFGQNIEYPLIITSWVNIYRKGSGIGWHIHNSVHNTYIKGYTANIFLGGDENIGLSYAVHDESNPRYRYKNMKNKIGSMIIMPNTTYHMVRKNPTHKKRYTVGMTITEYDQTLFKKILSISGGKMLEDESILILPKPEKSNKKNLLKYL